MTVSILEAALPPLDGVAAIVGKLVEEEPVFSLPNMQNLPG
jgi:hypothetical protein